MKTLALLSLLLVSAMASQAQGTVRFANFGPGLDAPIFTYDGGTLISGPSYMAELFVGTWPGTPIATTPFLSGAQAGYFDGGVLSISNVVGGGAVAIYIRIWNSGFGSFGAAQASGAPNTWCQSDLFGVVAGNPEGFNASPPAVLTPLSAMFLNTYLDMPPALHQRYNPTNRTVTLFWNGSLQTSTNLIDWTTLGTVSAQGSFSAGQWTYSADQMRQYFRASAPP